MSVVGGVGVSVCRFRCVGVSVPLCEGVRVCRWCSVVSRCVAVVWQCVRVSVGNGCSLSLRICVNIVEVRLQHNERLDSLDAV